MGNHELKQVNEKLPLLLSSMWFSDIIRVIIRVEFEFVCKKLFYHKKHYPHFFNNLG